MCVSRSGSEVAARLLTIPFLLQDLEIILDGEGVAPTPACVLTGVFATRRITDGSLT